MNAFCMKRRYTEEGEFQAPLRKRRYVPSGQIIPVNKRMQFTPSSFNGLEGRTYEMNPVVTQQMYDYEMSWENNNMETSSIASAAAATKPKSDMSMALVVYKRPDLITPVNVNDCDDDVSDKKKKKKKEWQLTPNTTSTWNFTSYSYNNYSNNDGSDMELD